MEPLWSERGLKLYRHLLGWRRTAPRSFATVPAALPQDPSARSVAPPLNQDVFKCKCRRTNRSVNERGRVLPFRLEPAPSHARHTAGWAEVTTALGITAAT